MLNYKQAVNRSVTQWFHTPKRDSISPAETIAFWNDKFLEGVAYRKFQLAISEREFRAAMCEALCTMFMAKKKQGTWRGPVSEMPRPEGWTDAHETEWKDLLRSKYFAYDFFELLWSQVEQAMWETAVPEWRTAFELIALHYIAVDPELVLDGYDDTEDVGIPETEE